MLLHRVHLVAVRAVLVVASEVRKGREWMEHLPQLTRHCCPSWRGGGISRRAPKSAHCAEPDGGCREAATDRSAVPCVHAGRGSFRAATVAGSHG